MNNNEHSDIKEVSQLKFWDTIHPFIKNIIQQAKRESLNLLIENDFSFRLSDYLTIWQNSLVKIIYFNDKYYIFDYHFKLHEITRWMSIAREHNNHLGWWIESVDDSAHIVFDTDGDSLFIQDVGWTNFFLTIIDEKDDPRPQIKWDIIFEA
jgi:hypothetical protein